MMSMSVLSLLGTMPTVAWLVEEATTLASFQSDFYQAATVGLIGRLWASPEAPDPLHEELPPQRCMAWARQHDRLDQVEAEAIIDARSLARALANLPDYLDDVGAERRSVALRALLASRDELESVAWVLGAANRGEYLRVLLRQVDQEAELQRTIIALECPATDDPHWLAVSATDPDAWWGAL